uniref:J domain-containing protein n=1 Tax=Macrostomum lignano TaxID=282301 RepID=A0A1I8I351_9PLAT
MSDDYYAVLELTRSATEGDIRKAYRRMALRWHPDKNQDNKEEAHLKFKEISEAYEVLSDPNKRQIYDVYGKAGLETDNGSGGGGRSHSRHHAGFHHDFHSFVFRDPQEVHAAVGGGGAAQFMSFSSSGLGPSTQFRSSSTSTRVVNGRQIVTKKVVENGVETVTVTENGRVVSKTVNGQAQSIEGPSGANAAASSSSSYGAGHHGYGSRAGGAAPAPRISSAHSLSGGGGRPGSSGSGG